MAGDSKAKIQREAEKYVIQGKIQQAIAEYQKIIKDDPDDVLTLNTIGDLCLRMGKPKEASTHFSLVAEHYARNNFLLKAIAVYRKILACDPDNVVVHKTLAALYAKQGLNVEARNEFLRVAEIYTEEGKTSDARAAYDKVAELDPSNVSAQLKLADINLREGSRDKAHFYLVAAAKAQAKAGDFTSARDNFQHALELKPEDVNAMTGLLDASIRAGKIPKALEVLNKSLDAGFETVELLEMLAKAHLSNNDPVRAAEMLKRVIALDESHYSLYLDLQKMLLDRKELDAAATCLDPVFPILIEKRATKRVIEGYRRILDQLPAHIPSLTRLADVYSASNDQASYLSTADRIISHYMEHTLYQEALVFLEKVLQVSPANEKYLRLHKQAFENVYPGIPYAAPGHAESAAPPEPAAIAFTEAQPGGSGTTETSPSLVEVDLLLNYGMRDKALELLRSAENRDPSDMGVRLRLLNLYRENNQISLAAEECLYLAQAHRKMGDEEAAQKYIDEAGRLDPAVVASRPELLSLAYQQGASAERASRSPAALAGESASEVDLSEDLSDIFFKDKGKTATEEVKPEGVVGDDLSEEFVPSAVPSRPPVSLPEQLQEVDFYIRLGFYDEARAKLAELERDHPGNPDLLQRKHQVGEGSPQNAAASAASAEGSETIELIPDEAAALDVPLIEDLKLIEEPLPTPEIELSPPEEEVAVPPAQPVPEPPVAVQNAPKAAPVPPKAPAPPVPEVREPEPKGMFADLLEEVNSLTDQEIAREEYETHFSLGIAYREMNLIDEAIKEFQDAMKALTPANHPTEVIQCCGMLSTCFLDKGMPRSAIRWCETGLAIPKISQHEQMALSYDMGVALAALGEADKALGFFTSLQEADPSYRDVAHRILELRGNSSRHVT